MRKPVEASESSLAAGMDLASTAGPKEPAVAAEEQAADADELGTPRSQERQRRVSTITMPPDRWMGAGYAARERTSRAQRVRRSQELQMARGSMQQAPEKGYPGEAAPALDAASDALPSKVWATATATA